MRISDLITEQIIKMIEESNDNIAEIQRNEFASAIGCVPSQINYVLSSRFTPEHGYLIESRRGGGGYIKITRVVLRKSSALMHIINSIGDSMDALTARVLLENCLSSELIDRQTEKIIKASISNSVMQSIPVAYRDYMRASLIKNILLTQI